MRQPKGFLDFIKNELTCKFCLFCFVFILVKFLLPKRFLVIHSTSFRVAIFHTIFETLLGLSHFKIMCIIINIYFDLQIKRCSFPLLVLDFSAFRASIMDNNSRKPFTGLGRKSTLFRRFQNTQHLLEIFILNVFSCENGSKS